MAYTTKLFILFLIFITGLLGYNYIVRPYSQQAEIEVAQQVASPLTQENTTIEEQLFASLTTEQKIAQVLAVPITINNTQNSSESAVLNWIKQKKPGFTIVFGNSIATSSAIALNKELKAITATDPLDIAITIDHEGGTVQRYNGTGFTKLPSWEELCELEDASERTRLLEQSAKELKEAGVAVVLAPVFDIKRAGSPLRTRTCSVDQAVISERSKEFISIMEKYSILPVIKHFPNIGLASKDLHTNFDSVSIRPDDLLALRAILTAHPSIGVMTSHVGVTNQNPETPCSLSVNCINELSKNYNDVLIISDALDMRATQGNISTQSAAISPIKEVSLNALMAGNDVIILGEQIDLEELDTVFSSLVEEYNTDETFKSRIDSNVKKIIRYKLNMRT